MAMNFWDFFFIVLFNLLKACTPHNILSFISNNIVGETERREWLHR